ncbi:MAG: hypothetical protein ACP5N9_03645 [Candidatus Bilamarchaeum sp.]|jgi:hypothetical protein
MRKIFILTTITFLAISGCVFLDHPQNNSTSNISINQPPTQLIGCDYKNPPCDVGYECKNNQCIERVNRIGCQFNNPSCDSNQVCIENRCQNQISLDSYCPIENRVELTTLDGSDIVYLTPGKCILFDTGERQYSIKFVRVVSTDPDQYEMEIIDSFGNRYTNQIVPLKYFRLGRDLTISAVLRVQDYRTLKLYPHRVITSDQLQINANCEGLTSAELCNQFKTNTKNYIKAMEQASGISLGECVDSVTYNFVSDITHGYAYNSGEKGLITAGTFANSIFSTTNYEGHEPMHLLYFCANIPNSENLNHSYWFASEEQFKRNYNDLDGASEALTNNQYWENMISNDPTTLNTETGMIGQCWGAKTHILNEKYLSLSAAERVTFLRTFYQRIKNSSEVVGLNDREAVAQIICDISQKPNCMQYLTNYCN